MRGLLKNNFYAALSNMKAFSVVMLFFGVFVAAMDNEVPSLLIRSEERRGGKECRL